MLSQGIENKFGATGDTQLFEDTKQIISYRMLTELKLFGDFAVPEALGDEEDDILFASSQQSFTANIRERYAAALPESLEHVTQLFAIRPDLAMVDAVDTLAQQFGGLMASANPHHASAESLDDLLAFAVVQQHNAPEGWRTLTNFLQKLEPRTRPGGQISADQSLIRTVRRRVGRDDRVCRVANDSQVVR